MYQSFRPFRLQPPVAASGFWSGFFPELTARSVDRIPFGDHGVIWASPLPSRLAATTGRMEFVILRTSHSPPVALHPLSRGRSYYWLQSSDPTSTGTSTLLIRYTYKRTRTDFLIRPGFVGVAVALPPQPIIARLTEQIGRIGESIPRNNAMMRSSAGVVQCPETGRQSTCFNTKPAER